VTDAPENATTDRNPALDQSHSFVLNALGDVVEGTDLVLEDDGSRQIVREAFDAVTDQAQREEFERALTEVRHEPAADDPSHGVARAIVDSTCRELIEHDVRVTLAHEARVVLSDRDVGLYNFVRSTDPDALADVPLSAAVRASVRRGAEAVAEGDYDGGLAEFERAIDAAETIDDAVTARGLAAWACHRDGDDATALDYVNEALELHQDAWAVRLVGTAAGHSSPQLFRDGKLSLRAYVRSRASVPPESEFGVDVGLADGTSSPTWRELSGEPGFVPLEQLAAETRVRLRLRGPLDEFPALNAYYLAVGVVDENNQVPRSVEYQPLTGPATADATETLRFERP